MSVLRPIQPILRLKSYGNHIKNTLNLPVRDQEYTLLRPEPCVLTPCLLFHKLRKQRDYINLDKAHMDYPHES